MLNSPGIKQTIDQKISRMDIKTSIITANARIRSYVMAFHRLDDQITGSFPRSSYRYLIVSH